MHVTTILITTFLLALGSCQKSSSGHQQDNTAMACELANQSNALREEDPSQLEQSTLLAIEAIQHGQRLESDTALRASLTLLQKPKFTLKNFDSQVLEFSHDGRWIVTGGQNGKLKLLDAENGNTKNEWLLDGEIKAVDFSFNDRLLAVGTSKNLLQVFDVESYRELTRHLHGGSVDVVTFSPDGRRLVTGSDDHMVRVFDSTNANTPLVSIPHHSRIIGVAFSPDGGSLLTTDGCANVFNSTTGKGVVLPCVETVNAVAFANGVYATASNDLSARIFQRDSTVESLRLMHQGAVLSVSFSFDGKFLVTASDDSTARVFDSSTGEEIIRLVHKGWVNAAIFSPDGSLVATGSSDSTARVFEWKTGREIARFAVDTAVNKIAFQPQGKSLAVTSEDGTLRLYPITDKTEILHLVPEFSMYSVDLSPDFRLLAIGGDQLWMYEVTGSKESWNKLTEGPVSTVMFSPNSRLVAAGDSRSTRVFNTDTGELARPLIHLKVRVLAFSGDSQRLLIGTAGVPSYTRVLNPANENDIPESPITQQCAIGAVAFTPSGERFATGCNDIEAHANEVRIFPFHTDQKADHKLALGPMTYDQPVIALAFSNDDKLLATGGFDRTAQVFDLSTGKRLVLRHPAPVGPLAFSHKDHWLATAASDGVIRIFNADTGAQIAQINNYLGKIMAVRFSEDDRFIATVAFGPGPSVSVRKYSFAPTDMVADACSLLAWNLSTSDWKRYMNGEPYRDTCPGLPHK